MLQVARYILAYVLWAVTCVVGFIVGFVIRNTYLLIFAVVTGEAAQQSVSARLTQTLQENALERFGIMFLALLMLILAVVAESLYRTGVPIGQLGRRFFMLTTVELGVLFVVHVVFFAQATSVKLLPITSGYVQLIELALLVLFAWLYSRQPGPRASD